MTRTVSYTHLDVYKRQIKHIALANGYKSHIVDRIINKKQNKPINGMYPKKK